MNADTSRSLVLSGNGNTLVVGGSWNDLVDPSIGQVRIYRRRDDEESASRSGAARWTRRGGVSGESVGDMAGARCAVSDDGGVFAVMASGNVGWVKVFQSGILDSWIQLGSTIEGEQGNRVESNGSSGVRSVSDVSAIGLSGDGTTLAVASNTTGEVVVLRYESFTRIWQRFGPVIVQQPNARDIDVSLSRNGRTVAVGVQVGLFHSVRVYRYSETNTVWSQLGDSLFGRGSGTAVSLSSDGMRLAMAGIARINPSDDSIIELPVFQLSADTNVWEKLGLRTNNSGNNEDGDNDSDNGAATVERTVQQVNLSGDGSTVSVVFPTSTAESANTTTLILTLSEASVWEPVGEALLGGWAVSLSDNGHSLGLGTTVQSSASEGTFGVFESPQRQNIFD